MIEVINGYFIDAGGLDYILKKDTGNVDKNGKKVHRVCGYYGSLKNALVGCVGLLQKEGLSDKELSLKEAIDISNQVTERFSKLLELAIKEADREEE